jgi:hypothetical protein
MAAGQPPVVESMPRYPLNTCSDREPLDAEHRGVGPHEGLCPDERGRGRARRAGDSASPPTGAAGQADVIR